MTSPPHATESLTLPVIQSLWIGASLSPLEQLSIRSFLRLGHPFHLFVYSPVDGIPPGVAIKDAAEIVPPDAIFRNKDFDSYASFADRFRYKLLHSLGGWWVDLDVIALSPFTFDSEYVFAAERRPNGVELPTNCVMRVPRADPVMQYLWEQSNLIRPEEIHWDECGPALVRKVIVQFSLEKYVVPADVFCPIDYSRWFDILIPGRCQGILQSDSKAVHFWREMWRRLDIDFAEDFAPRCLYERLKRLICNGSSTSGQTGCNGKHDVSSSYAGMHS